MEYYEQGQAFERQIGMMASDDLTTDITINAPRRVIAPFVFSVSKAATTKEISVCTFQEEAALDEFQSTAANLNFEIKRDCQWVWADQRPRGRKLFSQH